MRSHASQLLSAQPVVRLPASIVDASPQRCKRECLQGPRPPPGNRSTGLRTPRPPCSNTWVGARAAPAPSGCRIPPPIGGSRKSAARDGRWPAWRSPTAAPPAPGQAPPGYWSHPAPSAPARPFEAAKEQRRPCPRLGRCGHWPPPPVHPARADDDSDGSARTVEPSGWPLGAAPIRAGAPAGVGKRGGAGAADDGPVDGVEPVAERGPAAPRAGRSRPQPAIPSRTPGS